MHRRLIAAALAATTMITIGCASDPTAADTEKERDEIVDEIREDAIDETDEAYDASFDEWVDEALPYANDLQGALSDAGVAASAGDVSGLVNACDDLRDIAQDAQADTLPVPVHADLDDAWSNALESFIGASSACSAGAATLDADLIGEATDLMGEGTEHIVDATAIIEELNG